MITICKCVITHPVDTFLFIVIDTTIPVVHRSSSGALAFITNILGKIVSGETVVSTVASSAFSPNDHSRRKCAPDHPPGHRMTRTISPCKPVGVSLETATIRQKLCRVVWSSLRKIWPHNDVLLGSTVLFTGRYIFQLHAPAATIFTYYSSITYLTSTFPTTERHPLTP